MSNIIDITEWVRPAQPVAEVITGRVIPPVMPIGEFIPGRAAYVIARAIAENRNAGCNEIARIAVACLQTEGLLNG